jgi:hypothetical protein
MNLSRIVGKVWIVWCNVGDALVIEGIRSTDLLAIKLRDELRERFPGAEFFVEVWDVK